MRLKALLFVGLILALSAAPLMGGSTRVAIGYESLTVGATPTGLSGTTTRPANYPKPANYCYGTVETADIRVRVDGGAASSTAGHLARVDRELEVEGVENIQRFNAARAGSVDGALKMTCYRVETDQ